MADFLVSARKYRPQTFADMVGQEHVSNTLRNALKSQKLAHAFLFCGPRGVGKTTAARILAKTLNCQSLTPAFEACGKCNSCISFAQNSSFNIYELDAASNNSVEDIRELVNQVRFPPQSGKFKIYIIDEVHMLSQAAFNAFLKTLEEPPAYCKFILATTEKHKILPTILSRCQVFDFRRIPVETIVNHLRQICVRENISFDEEALHIIAQKADGGMRDSLSMLDRLVSFGDGQLKYEDVLENLNVLDYDFYFKVTEALLSENVVELISLFHQIIQKGFEGDDFVIGLCEHFRNLLFCKSPTTAHLLEISSGLKDRYVQQSAMASGNFLVNCLAIGNECDVRYKQSKNKRLTVELSLLKMCYVNRLTDNIQPTDKKKTDELNTSAPAQNLSDSTSPAFNEELTPESEAQTSTPDTGNPNNTANPNRSAPSPPLPHNPLSIRRTAKLSKATDQGENWQTSAPKTHQESAEADVSKPEKPLPLNQENVLAIWKKFSEQLPEIKRGAKALFTTFLPEWIEEHHLIQVKVLSEAQKDKLAEELHALKSFFEKLSGTDVSIEIAVDKVNVHTGIKIYYTEEEKLKRLLEKNPLIKKMQQQFGCEPDEQG
jgi:DNA polymerase-3 subunit gamma/tau